MLKKLWELADRAYVLVNGKVTIKGSRQELLKNKDIQAAYLEVGQKINFFSYLQDCN